MSNACGTISRVSAAAFALLIASVSPAHAQETDEFPVRVTVRTSQLRPDGFGSANWLTGYVDGTAATLKCSQCGQLQPGRFHGRWDKDTLRIRSTGMFGKHKVREDRFEVGLLGPKRDTSWSRDKPVLLTAYGTSEQQCVQPIRLANNVISKIDHPADWRVVIACTPQSWESASLEFHIVGGTRVAFTMWDNPKVPTGGVILTVLNAEQFDRCMRPGCYVHTILHELGHFRTLSSDENLVDADASEHEQALYREHPASEFPSMQDLKAAALFPLSVHLLEVQWPQGAAGAVTGTGRGNIFNGAASTTAFDFVTTCPDRLAITTDQASSYQGRWEAEPSRLSIVVTRPAPQPSYTCELKTEMKPAQVYLRNVGSGEVMPVTQEQFKARVDAARTATKAAPPKLTNADVVSMVALDISTSIIVAKIAASDCAFDTSPEGLRQLKAANVPDAVVLEMVKRSGR